MLPPRDATGIEVPDEVVEPLGGGGAASGRSPTMSGMTTFAGITEQADLSALSGVTGWFSLSIYILTVIALWRVFEKAGWPGVLAIVPIVNLFILVKIAGFSAWLTLLYIIPIVNLVLSIIVAIRVGRGFGKDGAFSFFLLWIPALQVIGYAIIGFGRATYTKPV